MGLPAAADSLTRAEAQPLPQIVVDVIALQARRS